MCRALGLSERRKIWHLALFSTLFSVGGGMVGYGLGWIYKEDFAQWTTHAFRCKDIFLCIKMGLQEWGGWLILAKAFVPIPYKIVCVAAGLIHMKWWTFVGASLLARSFRFVLFSFILSYPSSLERLMRRWHKPIGRFFLGISLILLMVGLIPLIKTFL